MRIGTELVRRMNMQADFRGKIPVAVPGAAAEMAGRDVVAVDTGPAALDALEESWRELESAVPDARYFSSFDWCASWWESFGRSEGRCIAVVTIRRDGVLQALMPLTLSRAPGFVSARLMGDDTGQYADCLVRPERRGDPKLSRAIAAGLSQLGVDRITLTNCREDAAIIELLGTIRRGKRWIRASETFNAEVRPEAFDGLAGYMKSRSSSLRKGLRRRRRKLAELGDVTHEHITDPAALKEAARQIVALKLAWLADSGFHGRLVARAGFEDWLLGVMRRASRNGKLHLSVIRVGERICAAQVAFRTDGELTAYFSAYDVKLSSYAVGKLHLEDHIVEVFERGIVLDLMPPSDAYKCEWGIEAVAAAAYTVPLTLKGAAVSAVVNVRSRALAKAAYMRLPAGLRAGVAAKLLETLRRTRRLAAGDAAVPIVPPSVQPVNAHEDRHDDR